MNTKTNVTKNVTLTLHGPLSTAGRYITTRLIQPKIKGKCNVQVNVHNNKMTEYANCTSAGLIIS